MSLRTVAALTIAFSLTLAAIGAVTAVPARGDAPGVHPAQTTPPATGDWHHVDLEAFGVWLPQGWQYEERQGVDSFVGAFVGDGARLTFDYGRYSNSLPDLGTPGYDVSFEEIGGKPAKLVVATSAPADLTGVYFAEATRDRYGCDTFRVNKLNVVGRDLTPEQQATALTVYRSIHFPGPGTWTVVPVPTLTGTLSAALMDIDMVSADEGWAVGMERDAAGKNRSTVLHYEGGRWHALPSPSEDFLWAVDMVSADEGWAVGDTSIVHYENGEWTLVDDALPHIVWDVEMVGPDDGWIVGVQTLMRYRDGQWQVQDEAGFDGAIRLNMLSADAGWAIGGGNLHRFEGDAWQSGPWPLPSLSEAYALEMTASPWGAGWMGGADGNDGWLARQCEDRYEPVTTTLPSVVWDIDMLDESGTEGWAVGGAANNDPALLAHFDNDAWTVLDSPIGGYLKAVDMVSRDEGWAVGAYYEGDGGGVLLHYTGPAQPPPPPGSTTTATPTPTAVTPTPTEPPTVTPTPPNGRTGIFLPHVIKAHMHVRLRGESAGIAASGGFVYMGDGSHIAVVDVSEPARPRVMQRVGPLSPDCGVFDVAVEGEFVYASCVDWSALPMSVDDKTTIAVLRAATDTAPAAVASTLRIKEMALDLAVQDGWIYVGGWWCGPSGDCEGDRRGGVVVIDARDPDALSYVDFAPVNARFSADLLVDDGYLYVAGGHPDPASGLDGPVISVLDLAQPHAPEPVADIAGQLPDRIEEPWFSALTRHSGLLYAVPGLSVFDTRVPSQPRHLANLEFDAHFGPIDVGSGGDYVYLVAHIDDPQLFQVAAPLDPATPPGATVDADVIGQVALPGWVSLSGGVEDVLAVNGDHVYLARGIEVGLYVIDVRDPAAPTVVGELVR